MMSENQIITKDTLPCFAVDQSDNSSEPCAQLAIVILFVSLEKSNWRVGEREVRLSGTISSTWRDLSIAR